MVIGGTKRMIRRDPKPILLLTWAALALMWFATAQLRPLMDPDEGRYAEIPREMVATGDWITPRLDGLKYFEKPPLQYWATAVAYEVFGQSEFTSRLWSFGLAFASLPMVLIWTRRFYGENAGRAAFLALAASPYFGIVGHINLLDAGFTFWMMATVLAFVTAQSSAPGSSAERRWMLAAWLSAALAVLSKGIVVGVLAGGSLIAYSLIERDVRPWKRLHFLVGLPAFLLVAAPWFVLVSMRNPNFAQFFFVHEHFARFLTKVHERYEPWWYFIPLLLVAISLWVPSLVRACRTAWRNAVPSDQLDPTASFKPLKFLLIYCAFTFVFFSISDSKLAPYIMPIIPALAAVLGAGIGENLGSLTSSTARNGAILGTVIGIGLLVYSWLHSHSVPSDVLIWSVGGIVVAIAGWALARRASQQTNTAFTAAAAAVLTWQFLLTAFSLTSPPPQTSRAIVDVVQPYVHPGTELYGVGYYRQTLAPYLRRTMTIVDYEGELEFGLHAEPGLNSASPDEFIRRWTAARDAVAFFHPKQWPHYQALHLPGRVIADDGETVVVARQ
jgi:4-amino-4-deoxy-L-arabinose transferase-like glycosyltransferase